MQITRKMKYFLFLSSLGLGQSQSPLSSPIAQSEGVAVNQSQRGQRPERLPCQHPRRGGIRPRDWIRPDQCCGPDKPYHTSQKSCCQNTEGTTFHLINIIEKPDHKCCNGVVYDSKKMNCCQDQVVPYSSDLCPKCSLSDWSEWSECNEWSLSTRSRELLPNPGYTRDECQSALEYNSEIEASALGDVGYEMKEEYGYWVDERSMDAGGVPCTGEMGARFLDKIIGVRDPENQQSDVEYRDLLILVDESTSIGAENFEIVKRTLALMVANLCGGVGLHKNRVGLMRFSSAVKPDLHFSEGIALNKVLNKIEGLQYKTIVNKNQHGTTYTANAMNHALNTVFKTENGWRDGVHPEGDHVRTEVIIITDGESNDPDNTFTIEGQKLKYDEAGIKVYALGVGDIKKNELETLTSRQTESIFYLLSWKHLAGFNYMVESLMSHEAFEENGRCIPFTLDPEHKKKAIALHDQNYTQQVGMTVGDIVEAAKERAMQERKLIIESKRQENKARRLEAKSDRQADQEMSKIQELNANFVQEFDYDQDTEEYMDLGSLPWGARGRKISENFEKIRISEKLDSVE